MRDGNKDDDVTSRFTLLAYYHDEGLAGYRSCHCQRPLRVSTGFNEIYSILNTLVEDVLTKRLVVMIVNSGKSPSISLCLAPFKLNDSISVSGQRPDRQRLKTRAF
jgi:hypothetical protein